MIKSLFRLKDKLGIDKSIFFTSLVRIIQATGGIISILFVAHYLTGAEQGFYYTFGSIVAIQVFFELGLNGIITQYVAHEAAHLQWKTSTKLTGDPKYLSRLSSLLHFSVKWYLYFMVILFVTLIVFGFLFFEKYGTDGNIIWRAPWILLAIGTALNLFVTPILAFIEGLGKVKEVAKIRLYQQTICLFVVCGGLIIGAKLYVLGINLLVAILLIVSILFFGKFRKLLLHIWHIPITDKVDYRKEIFPFQWKIALSWISGYFIFQLFNPVLFATEGAVIAGQMGMTLTALNGIQALSISWMTTKVPLYSGLIAQKKHTQLDTIFKRTLKQSVSINGCLLLIMFAGIFILREWHISFASMDIANRFLAYLPMALMMIPLFVNQFIASWATYLRCHKQEPFLFVSICCGSACCLSTIILGKYFGVLGITIGYCIITLAFCPWCYWIYKTKKDEWHEKSISHCYY